MNRGRTAQRKDRLGCLVTLHPDKGGGGGGGVGGGDGGARGLYARSSEILGRSPAASQPYHSPTAPALAARPAARARGDMTRAAVAAGDCD